MDPQQNGLDDAFTLEQYRQMCAFLTERIGIDKDPKDAIMTMMLLTMLFAATGRSDESLLLGICDFGRPVIQPNVGPCAAELHKLNVSMSKTHKNEVMPLIPHVNVEQCPVLAICTYMHLRFAMMKEKFPDAELQYNDEW